MLDRKPNLRVAVYGNVRAVLSGLTYALPREPIHAPDCERCGVRPATRSAHNGTEYCAACFWTVIDRGVQR